MTGDIHVSLSRQLRRLALSTDVPPTRTQWSVLLKVVSDSYADSDADRYTLERSIEISSEEMRALHDVLSDRALTDSLTGLPNRAALCALLDEELLAIAGRPVNLALLFIDLDGFKRVNDSLGHAAGDELLIRVAERIRASVRADDVVARLGGDEFVVCCRDLADRTLVPVIARRIVEQVEVPFRIGGQNVAIGASVGIAYARPDGEAVAPVSDSEELLGRADLAMYEAKTTGRSRFVVFDQQMGRRAEDRLATENDLRRAVHRDELVLHYQPIFDFAATRLIGLEALVRWNRPGHGLVQPDDFIPIAEQSRLITTLDAWVLRRACLDAATWPDDNLGVSVNISVRDLQHQDVVTAVSDALHASGLRPGRLTLELTETTLMSDSPAVALNLAQVEALGVQLAIDDFGTGHCSLSSLRDLPSRTVKIDRTFIDTIARDPVSASIVGAIITMAHAVGQRVVAEGVETVEQADQLRLLGCDSVQGYLYGRPQPLDSADCPVTASRLRPA